MAIQELVRLFATFVYVNSTKQTSAPTSKQTTIKGKPLKIWYCDMVWEREGEVHLCESAGIKADS